MMRLDEPEDPRPEDPEPGRRRCTICGASMEFTGLPDISGPIRHRFYRCENCGLVRVDVDEDGDGYG
ncbi:MAG: hypothetical protein AAGD10_10315 [Myxococcota bacterium]